MTQRLAEYVIGSSLTLYRALGERFGPNACICATELRVFYQGSLLQLDVPDA